MQRIQLRMGFKGRRFSSASLTIFFAFTTPPTPARRTLLSNAVVKPLLTSGLWYRLDRLRLYAAADSQASLTNLVKPGTGDAINNGATFLADQGWTTNGTSTFVDANFNPTTGGQKFAQDDCSGGVWTRTAGQQAGGDFGWFDGTDGFTILCRDVSDRIATRVNSATNTLTTGQTDGSKLTSVERTGSAANRVLKNGVSLTTPNTTSAAMNNFSFHLGNVVTAGFSARQYAADFVGSSLGAGVAANSAAAHLIMYNALQAYMTGVGA